MKTRAQEAMALAHRRVSEVIGEPYAKTYGSLCHNFPIMVLTSGLCQAVAFSDAKSAKEKAHARILDDVSAILQRDARDVATVSADEYILMTRRVLDAWIYYKRFAVSVLGVEGGQGDTND